MKHDDLREVSELLASRASAIRLMQAASGGIFGRFEIAFEGTVLQVFGVVSEDQLRQAIIESCDDHIRATDKSLKNLGVSTPKHVEQPETLDEWKRAAEMYLRAWVRELGGTLKGKRHLIDALVMTTREMREKALLHSVPVVPKSLHDERVKELIEDNNRHQQEARDARRALAEYRALSPFDRLAADVHRAVTDVLNKHNAKEA